MVRRLLERSRRSRGWAWLASVCLAAISCGTHPAPELLDADTPNIDSHELGLPVFHLGTAEDINDDDYTPLSLVYAGKTYAGAAAKYRGATSSKYPKRSFTLKLDKSERFTDTELGFQEARRLVLTSTFDDNSQIRQRLAFELWNRLDQDHITIHHFNAVVYLNGQYHGVYLVTDRINDDLLASQGYAPTVNVYKARQQDANFSQTNRKDTPKTRLASGYTKEEGFPIAGEAGAYDDLEQLVSWVATATDAEFRDQFSARVAPDFERWFILVSLIAAVDTTAKNYYLVHDARPDAADPRWHFAPWGLQRQLRTELPDRAPRTGPVRPRALRAAESPVRAHGTRCSAPLAAHAALSRCARARFG